MRGDAPCRRFDDLTPRERRKCWAIAAAGVAVLFAATVGWDALAALM